MADHLGLLHIYTGDGKGKTSAAIGLAVRAAGRGLDCRVIQFMKERTVSGENLALVAIPNIKIDRLGLNLIGAGAPDVEQVKASLIPAVEASLTAVARGFDLVVLDEILTAATLGLITEGQMDQILAAKGAHVELVLTGREAGAKLIAKADLVTEMKMIKHPFDRGLAARSGIDF